MSHHRNASAAELARRIEQYLPVFARPMLADLIAAVQRETHVGDTAGIRTEYPPDRTHVAPANVTGSTAPALIAPGEAARLADSYDYPPE